MVIKNRNQTIQSRLGFNDKELTTPEHDKICLWVNNNYPKILSDLKLIQTSNDEYRCNLEKCPFFKNSGYSKRHLCKSKINKTEIPILNEKKEKIDWRNYDERKKIQEQITKIKEKCICDFSFDNSFLCSGEYSSDLVKHQRRMNNFKIELDCFKWHIHWEHPIRSNQYIVGFVDFLILLENYDLDIGCMNKKISQKYNRFFIEVKPEIKSIGETIRQIQMYKTYTEKSLYIIVTKTKGLKKLFEEQNIFIYEYEEEQKKLGGLDDTKTT